MKTQEPGNEPSQVIPLCKDVKVSSPQYSNVPFSEMNEESLLSFVTEKTKSTIFLELIHSPSTESIFLPEGS